MAKNKDVPEPTPDNINAALEHVASAVKSTVGALWKIFVRFYVAKGVSEVIVAGAIGWLTIDKLWAHYWIWWLCIPFPVMLVLTLDAVKLLINPHYYAMNDIIERIKEERKHGDGAMHIFTDGKRVP